MTAIEATTNRGRFYTLEPSIVPIGCEASLQSASVLNGLITRCLNPLVAASKDRKLKLYPQQGEVFSPFNKEKDRKEFTKEALAVASFYTHDLFNTNGTLRPDCEQTWRNLEEITPVLVGILAGPQNYIEGVAQSQALNALAAALQMVRDPSSQMTFKVGIGGSDAATTPASFLVYGLSALKSAEAVAILYQKRERNKLENAAVAKKIAQEALLGEIVGERKGQIRQEIETVYTRTGKQGLIEQGYLEDEEVKEAQDKYAITTNPSTIQFIFTPEAALQINFSGKEEVVRRNAQANARVLKQFVDSYFPTISQKVQYIFDLSWDKHPKETIHMLDYLSEMIGESREEIVVKRREDLEERGRSHGGEAGAIRSRRYIAMHRLAFEDDGVLPAVPYMEYKDSQEQAAKAEIIITHGCRGEAKFNFFRIFMGQQGSREDLAVFLQEQIDQGRTEYKQTLDWLVRITSEKEGLDLNILQRPFRSKIDLAMINTAAKHKAGYYVGEGDISAEDLTAEALQVSVRELNEVLADSGIDNPRRLRLETVRNDHQMLLDEMTNRQKLIRAAA